MIHGLGRSTFDVDILIEPSVDNARRLLQALEEAGFGTAALTTPEQVALHEITRFRDRYLLDVMTRTPGITFDEAWSRREQVRAGTSHCFILSRDDLIRSKSAAGRQKDIEDVRAMEGRQQADQ